MISRDRVIRTLNHQSIDRAPRDLWLLPGMEAGRPDDVAEMNAPFSQRRVALGNEMARRKAQQRPTVKSPVPTRMPGDAPGNWANTAAGAGLIESPLAGGVGSRNL